MSPFLVLLFLAQLETLPERPEAPLVDQAGALSLADREALTAQLLAIERETGHQIAVAVVDSLAGLTVEEYAERLFRRWSVGRKGKDDGALVLLAVGDRRVRIEVGYGLEGELPDGKVGEILDRAVPQLKAKEWGGALRTIVGAVAAAVSGTKASEARPAPAAQSREQAAQQPLASGSGRPSPGAGPGAERAGEILAAQFALIAGLAFAFFLGLKAAFRSFPGRGAFIGGALWFGLAALLAIAAAGALGAVLAFAAAMANLGIASVIHRHRCPACRKWMAIDSRTLSYPTSFRDGMRELVAHCAHCNYRKVWTVRIPRAARSASSFGTGTSFGGRSSGGSWGGFGGGRSGGGGASRGF